MLGRTEKYCSAAAPDLESKKAAFFSIFEESDDLSLCHVQELCRGYRQYSQREMLQTLSDEFFNRIEDCVNKKAHSITQYIYMFLAPTMIANDEELARLNALKTKLEAYSPEEKQEGTGRLLNWVKDSIQEIEQKKFGRELSRTWEAQQNAPVANL